MQALTCITKSSRIEYDLRTMSRRLKVLNLENHNVESFSLPQNGLEGISWAIATHRKTSTKSSNEDYSLVNKVTLNSALEKKNEIGEQLCLYSHRKNRDFPSTKQPPLSANLYPDNVDFKVNFNMEIKITQTKL